MNDQPGLVLAFKHLRNDLIKGHDFHFNPRSEKLQGEIRSCQLAGNSDALLLHVRSRESARGNDHRTIALADAAPARQQSIVILNIRISVERDSCYVVHAFLRFAVKRLNVAECVRETQARYTHFMRGQPVKHERVIRVGAVRHRDFASPGFAGGRTSQFLGGAGRRHACTLGARRSRTATAAAIRILITSANKNQYKPNCTARFIEPVRIASQANPLMKSNSSASNPATAARANVLRLRSITNPASPATNG